MKPHKEKNPQEFFETDGDLDSKVDDIYSSQRDYFKTPHGKRALRRARKNYDKKNPEKRRQQKRDYMRRKRERDPDIWK